MATPSQYRSSATFETPTQTSYNTPMRTTGSAAPPQSSTFIPSLFMGTPSQPSQSSYGSESLSSRSPYRTESVDIGDRRYGSPESIRVERRESFGGDRMTTASDLPPPITSLFETVASPGSSFSEFGSLSSLPTKPLSEPASGYQYQSWSSNDNGIGRSNQESGFWVTVFGFPPASTSLVLQQFQSIGTIVQYEAGEGNFVHVRFATRLDAQKALTLHGRVIGGRLMIGVIPTAKTEFAVGNNDVPARSINANKPYRARDTEYEILRPKEIALPRPSNSLLTTVLDWFFGW